MSGFIVYLLIAGKPCNSVSARRRLTTSIEGREDKNAEKVKDKGEKMNKKQTEKREKTYL